MKVLCPGSYHPPTLGHIDILRRAAALFDEVVAAVMVNPEKRYVFSAEDRVEMLRLCLADVPNVRVLADSGLTAELCRREGADAILHGVRSAADYEYEAPLAVANAAIGASETVFLPADPALAHISSTIAMDVARHGGPLERFLPQPICEWVANALKER